MNTHDAIRNALNVSSMIVKSYLSDLDDNEILVRVAPEANHPAWQIGHLIKSEHGIMSAIKPGASPDLPEGFAERHDKPAAKSDDASQFEKKSVYLDLYNKQREATLAILESLSDSDLDKPGPEPLRRICPNVGTSINFLALHELTHAGQWVPLRRKLGKAVLI